MAPDDRHEARLATFEAATRRPMAAVSLAVIPVFVGQALADGGSAWLTGPLRAARLAIHLAMALDICVRTALAPRRLRYLARHPLDVLAVVLPPVRALRQVVALRTILLQPGLVRFIAFAATTVAGSALVVYATEHDRRGADIQSMGDAFWWAVVTATTVGYGDEVPVTGQGRAMALLLMLMGIASFSVLTAHVATYVGGANRGDATSDELLDRLTRMEAALTTIEIHLRRRQTPTHEGRSS